MNEVKDISDLHRLNGGSSLLGAVNQFRRPAVAAPQQTVPKIELPAIVSASDLMGKDTPEPAQLIKGLLHQGSKMVLGGGSKSFKTWSLVDLAMSVASGRPWWGFESTKSRVLYINLELPEWSMKKRIEEIRYARPELDGMKNLDVWNLRGHSVSFDLLRPQFAQRLGQEYGLFLIDPIYKVYGNRDENSAGEMGTLLNEVEKLTVQTGAAVVFGAHFSKGNQAGKESIDRISGSGVFARDPDSILVMTKHEAEETFTVEATLRNFKPIEPFCVQRQHPLMVRNEGLDPTKLKQAGFKTKYTVDQLIEVLGDQSLSTTAWLLQASHKTGIKKSTFMEKLKLLKDDNTKVVQNADDEWTAVNVTKKKEVGPMVQQVQSDLLDQVSTISPAAAL